jgi:hypothetical protein
MPITLPAFDAIARSTLVEWWRGLAAADTTTGQPGGAGDAPRSVFLLCDRYIGVPPTFGVSKR